MGSVAIIGAGISGLTAGKRLVALGHEVVIYEKSRSLSGRCATRLWNHHIVDHGAQYFTVSSNEFEQELKALPSSEISAIKAPVFNKEGMELIATGGKRFYNLSGNNRIGKDLAASLDIRKGQKVECFERKRGSWQVMEELYDAVLVTAPWPQTANLLGFNGEESSYLPCLTAFFEFEGTNLGRSAGRYALSIRDKNELLAWSACENHKEKRIRGNKSVFVVQASACYSRDWIEEQPSNYLPKLLERLQELWEIDQIPSASFAHRWRFARRATVVDPPDLPAGVFIAGDSRVDSKLEAVWLDGKRAAAEIHQTLQ